MGLAQRAKAEAERIREREAEREIAKLKSANGLLQQKLKQRDYELELAYKGHDFLNSLGEPKPSRIEFKPHKQSGSATAVLVLNDWHAEETVDPKTINGLNEFNLEIAERRIKRVFEKAVVVLNAARTLSNIRELVLAILGDMITGHIHEDLVEVASLSPTQASLFVQDQLCGGIEYLLKHADCKTITIPTCYGNHGRTTQKPRLAMAHAHSYEWLLYRQLERHYRTEPRVRWKVENGYHNWLDIQGKRVRFHHGDWIKYQGGVGGITIPVMKALNGWDRGARADYDFFGHWHQYMEHPRFTACNCLIGYNAHALSIKADFSLPSQTFAVFDRNQPEPVLVQKVFCE